MYIQTTHICIYVYDIYTFIHNVTHDAKAGNKMVCVCVHECIHVY